MATRDGLRAELDSARRELEAAIQAAVANWERQPEHGEGEEAWSARQAAEHVVRAEVYYATTASKALGHDAPANPFADAPPDFPDIDAALAAYGLAVEAADSALVQVGPDDLAIEHDRFGNVEGILTSHLEHVRNHANQIAGAAGS